MGNSRIAATRGWLRLHCLLVALTIAGGCQRAEPPGIATAPVYPPITTPRLDQAQCPFEIYWPPHDRDEATASSIKPLLGGTVGIKSKELAPGENELRVAITLTRASGEADREYWNKVLAFADLPWMDEVRVWDADAKWIWPNLPYILRPPGRERIERYGGRDPSKHVDNDFAAVLIRKFDADGRVESDETREAPLVSAEWRPPGQTKTDLTSVVHAAKSDDFVLHLGTANQMSRGQLKVWLIYADFFGSRPPKTWPKEREWAGGILAYFEIDWQTAPGSGCHGIVHPTKPQESTHFNWTRWVRRAPESVYSEADVRLTD